MGVFDRWFGGGKEFAGRLVKRRDFARRDLTGADFKKANLSDCVLQSAILADADFTGALLDRCDFTGADLRGARFDGAEVLHSTFTGATTERMSTSGATFTGCTGLPDTAYAKLEDVVDDDARRRFVRRRLEAIAFVVSGGRIEDRRDDDALCLAGSYREHRARVVVETTSGSLELEVEARTGCGTLEVHHVRDPDADPRPEDRCDLAPGVFLAGDTAELARMKGLLSAGVAGMFVRFMPAANATLVRVDDDRVHVWLDDDVLHGDLAVRTREALDFVASLVVALVR